MDSLNVQTDIKAKEYRGCGFMTICKYNNSGNTIYICDKESKVITAVDTNTYSVYGIFESHNGVIWSLDITSDDKFMVSISGDMSIIIWDTTNGNKIEQIHQKAIPKAISIQQNLLSNYMAVYCESISRRSKSYIIIYNLSEITTNSNPIYTIEWSKINYKPTTILWLNDIKLIVGCDNGQILILDITNPEYEQIYSFHTSAIKSFVFNKNKTILLTGSLDQTAKEIDIHQSEWKIKSTYIADTPVNCAIYNHNDRKIMLAGGQDAMNVALTASSTNDLKIKIFRTNDQKLMNYICGSHFGPVRYMDKAPYNSNSKCFVTASQDGTVKFYLEDNNTNQILDNKLNINTELLFGIDERQSLENKIFKLDNLNLKVSQFKQKEKIEPKYIIGMNHKLNPLYQFSSKIEENDFNAYQVPIVNTTLRVSNLPYDVRVGDLYQLFEIFGRIDENSINIKHYNDNVIGFVKYTNVESTMRAIEVMHKKPYDHNILDVELSRPRVN